MKYIMIHEITDEFLNTKFNEEDVLTFDDGLYSLYYYWNKIKELPNKKILFITPTFIEFSKKNERNYFNMKSSEVMYKFFLEKNNNGYLTYYELEEILKDSLVSVGMHGYTHDVILSTLKSNDIFINEWRYYRYLNTNKINLIRKMFKIQSILAYQGYDVIDNNIIKRTYDDYVNYIQYEIDSSIDWFKEYINTPTIFCAPFNEWSIEMYDYLKYRNVNELYGGLYTNLNDDIIKRPDWKKEYEKDNFL